jgi:AraC family transcriptional regulator of adaptative response/methylated-DNA-[protein]-cysteine methyltransferase
MNTLLKNQTNSDAVLADPRWKSLIDKDVSADGSFYYSVKSTGVYCRPSCGSRTPLPQNVGFHLTIEDAENAGFRACKRCKPNEPHRSVQHAAIVTEACKLIESSEELPNLEALAEHAGFSLFYFHRLFKSIAGLTPKAYATAHRSKRLKEQLDSSPSVTNAIYEAGFNSNSRFYENSNKVLGMTPSAYRAGGANTVIKFAIAECSLGSVLVASSELGVCAILLGDDPNALAIDLQDRFPKSTLIGGDDNYERLAAKVIGFIEAPSIGLNLPLDIRGTVFQQRVWQALKKIPVGTTASYTDIAQLIGSPKSVRAVAAACAANALAVAIPCHRVVKQDGAISGYRWGVERKKALLKLEATLVNSNEANQ